MLFRLFNIETWHIHMCIVQNTNYIIIIWIFTHRLIKTHSYICMCMPIGICKSRQVYQVLGISILIFSVTIWDGDFTEEIYFCFRVGVASAGVLEGPLLVLKTLIVNIASKSVLSATPSSPLFILLLLLLFSREV